jgi:hypothetical protein
MSVTLTAAQQDLVLAFQDQLGRFGHVMSSGTNSFPCTVIAMNPVDIAMSELFQDKREVSVVTALKTDLPSGIVAQSTFTDENNQSWTVMQRENNSSTICTKFWVVQQTDKDH